MSDSEETQHRFGFGVEDYIKMKLMEFINKKPKPKE
jgi:hypothetical protein